MFYKLCSHWILRKVVYEYPISFPQVDGGGGGATTAAGWPFSSATAKIGYLAFCHSDNLDKVICCIEYP